MLKSSSITVAPKQEMMPERVGSTAIGWFPVRLRNGFPRDNALFFRLPRKSKWIMMCGVRLMDEFDI